MLESFAGDPFKQIESHFTRFGYDNLGIISVLFKD